MTPIRHQGAESSPIRLMQQRTIRGILPVRQQETNQCNYEKFRTRKLEQSQYQTGQKLAYITYWFKCIILQCCKKSMVTRGDS